MKALTIRIPEETYDTLSRLALEDDRSVAKFVSRFLVLSYSTGSSPVSWSWTTAVPAPSPTQSVHDAVSGESLDAAPLTPLGEFLSAEANRGSDLDNSPDGWKGDPVPSWAPPKYPGQLWDASIRAWIDAPSPRFTRVPVGDGPTTTPLAPRDPPPSGKSAFSDVMDVNDAQKAESGISLAPMLDGDGNIVAPGKIVEPSGKS